MIAKSNLMSFYSIGLRLTLPEVQAWLQPKIAASWAAVPADCGNPPQLACTAGAGRVNVSWDGRASGLLLKKSSDLNVWERVDRAGGATTIYGPGTYNDVTTGRPSLSIASSNHEMQGRSVEVCCFMKEIVEKCSPSGSG